jgi:hypothetical protein
VGWNGRTEVSGNVLFGAARGRLVSLAAAASRADSALEAEVDMRLSYADAVADNEDARRVTARASRFSLGADYRPFDRVSPFVFGSMETSLQQRIARRFATGAGAKYTFSRDGDNDLSLSLALLWEHTRALDPDSTQPATTSRTRWSLRGRVRRKLASNVSFSHVTFYQPAVDRFERYTADSNTSLAFAFNETLALTLTLRDHIDSEARRRGARSAHDGQFLFGLSASF